MNNKPLTETPEPCYYPVSSQTRYLWISLTLYVVAFIIYAAIDLYRDQPTVGLFNTHLPPTNSVYGNVLDPKPNLRIEDELRARVPPNPPIQMDRVFDRVSMRAHPNVIEHSVRLPKSKELLLGKQTNGELMLIIGEYLGEWVTFRSGVGVILEPNNPLVDVELGVILRARQ
ncbi:MAG: hypothetical protein ACPGQS_08230 [Bradymonadia bacterium]